MTRRTLGRLLLDGLDKQSPAITSAASSWNSIGSMNLVFRTFPKRYSGMDGTPDGDNTPASLESEVSQTSEPPAVFRMAASRLAISRP
jgi:hypothetical protein